MKRGLRRQILAPTEAEWREVFRLRCASKRGDVLSPDQRALCEHAYRVDPTRYSAMNNDVFNATVPFGSTARKP